jgi:hypothetical protein
MLSDEKTSSSSSNSFSRPRSSMSTRRFIKFCFAETTRVRKENKLEANRLKMKREIEFEHKVS